jgi:hypothetical protein
MMPIDILQTDTVGKSAAQSVSARKAVEPFLKRRIREASVVMSGLERTQRRTAQRLPR